MNKDTFRKRYHTLLEVNTALVTEAKEKAEELEQIMRNVESREMSLAITNLEQAMMWCTKAIVLNDQKQQEENNGKVDS